MKRPWNGLTPSFLSTFISTFKSTSGLAFLPSYLPCHLSVSKAQSLLTSITLMSLLLVSLADPLKSILHTQRDFSKTKI